MQLSDFIVLAGKVSAPAAFLTGLALQTLLTVTLPYRVSLLFTAALAFALYYYRYTPQHGATAFAQPINRGRFHAQLPHLDNTGVANGKGQGVVVFIIGVTTRKYGRALCFCSCIFRRIRADRGRTGRGRLDPAFREMSRRFQEIWKDAETNPEKTGCMSIFIDLISNTRVLGHTELSA